MPNGYESRFSFSTMSAQMPAVVRARQGGKDLMREEMKLLFDASCRMRLDSGAWYAPLADLLDDAAFEIPVKGAGKSARALRVARAFLEWHAQENETEGDPHDR